MPSTFQQLQGDAHVLHDLMDAFHSASRSPGSSRDVHSMDSRDRYRGLRPGVPLVLRLLYVDEFTTSLLVDFTEESSALFAALAGWGTAHTLTGISYGYGEVTYYTPEDVRRVALQLRDYPDALLEARFRDHADTFRMGSSAYFADDQSILEHQRSFAALLRRLYDEAAQDGDFVLLLTV
jgi:hypothetical protein